MYKMYFNYLNIIKQDKFVLHYTTAVGIAIIIDWLLMAMFTKFMGLYVPVIMITIYYIVSEMGGYIEQLLHDKNISSVFLVLIISDIVQILCMSIFFYDVVIFTYALMFVFSLQAILYEVYSIKALQFIENYSDIKPSKIQSYLLFNRSNAVLIGLIMGGVYALLFSNYGILILFTILLGTVSIYHETKLYRYIKAKINYN